ncbi:MAG: hypothetical protein ACAI25_02315 [Planctomycetota bacterium]
MADKQEQTGSNNVQIGDVQINVVGPGGASAPGGVAAGGVVVEGGSAFRSFLTVALIALVVCGALVGGAVFLLSGSSQLPFNYQGFDNK